MTMVNQAKQNVIYNCKWGACTFKFASMELLWKHVEQHVDNAIPRLVHLVNDDDDAPVMAPQNKTMAKKSSINSVTTSQINQSQNAHPVHINTVMNGTSNVNNGQNINLVLSNLNLQGMQQTSQSRLPQGSRILAPQTGPTMTYSFQKQQYIILPPQLQQMSQHAFLIQQQQMIQSVGQSANAIPLGSMPNPITIDDNNTIDVDRPVTNSSHQGLGGHSVTQVQTKNANPNRNAQPLIQNTKK